MIAVQKKKKIVDDVSGTRTDFGFWIQAKGFIVLHGSSSSCSSSSSRVLDRKSVIFSAVQHKYIQTYITSSLKTSYTVHKTLTSAQNSL